MSCGGRIYKGDSIAISIPFDVSGYTDLVVDYFTIGDTKIVRDESGLTVADGYITAEFSGHDLDLLPDGVVRYTIEYAVDNTDYVESSNTMLFLKTPASYSAMTEEQVFNSGYTAGLEACSGDCSQQVAEAYSSGYTYGEQVGYQEGYEQGRSDCPECDCSSAITEAYASGMTEGKEIGYQSGYTQGYEQGQEDCPDCPACDCTEAYQSGLTVGFLSGFSAGHIYSGSLLETEIEGISIDFTGQESSLFGSSNYAWYIDDKRVFTGCYTEYTGRRISQFINRVENSENRVISKVEFYTLTNRLDSVEDFTVTDLTINYVWHPTIVSQIKRTEGDYTYVTLELE